MPTRRIKMIVQYDGEPFQGWQYQANGPSVQETLEAAIEKMLGERIRLFVAGRTDSGVHAAAMPVHFDTAHAIPAARLPRALAKFLPDSISVLRAEDAPPTFDARRGAILRWYRYQVLQTRLRLPLGPRAWHVPRALDAEAMRRGLELLRGKHDFQGFRSSQCQARRTALTMRQATLTCAGDLLALDFKCRSFLHHMVRFLAGSLVAMGRGRLSESRLLRIRDAGERPQLIYCAPPQGLCLMGVAYDESERATLLAACPPPPSF